MHEMMAIFFGIIISILIFCILPSPFVCVIGTFREHFFLRCFLVTFITFSVIVSLIFMRRVLERSKWRLDDLDALSYLL